MFNRAGTDKERRNSGRKIREERENTDRHREKEKEGRKRGLAEANRFLPPAAREQCSKQKPFKTTVQKATLGSRLN